MNISVLGCEDTNLYFYKNVDFILKKNAVKYNVFFSLRNICNLKKRTCQKLMTVMNVRVGETRLSDSATNQ